MRRRFSRKRKGNGSGDGRSGPIDAARTLERIVEEQIVAVPALEAVEHADIPADFAAVGTGQREDGTRVVVAFAPRSGGDAVLAGAVTGARLAAEDGGFSGEVVAVAPQWSSAARRRLGLLGELPYTFRAAEAPALGDGDVGVVADAAVLPVVLPVDAVGARLADIADRNLFARATAALEGLASKHGGAVRGCGDRVELVIMARRVAELCAIDGQIDLNTILPQRSTTRLASDDLAEAFDRLEGHLRKRLGDRRTRDGEEGMRARLIPLLASAQGLRAVAAWPLGGSDEDAIDLVGVSATGDVVIGAIREEFGLEALGAVLDAALSLQPMLPTVLAGVDAPVKIGAPRLALAARSFASGTPRALESLGLAYELLEVRMARGRGFEVATLGSGVGSALSEGRAEEAPRASRPPRGGRSAESSDTAEEAPRASRPPRGGRSAESSGTAEEGGEGRGRRRRSRRPRGDRPERDDTSDAEADSTARVQSGDADSGEAGEANGNESEARSGQRRGRRSGRGRGGRGRSTGGEARVVDGDATASPDGEARESSERKPAPRFDEFSSFDLEEDSASADGEGGRPRRRGRSRRRGRRSSAGGRDEGASSESDSQRPEAEAGDDAASDDSLIVDDDITHLAELPDVDEIAEPTYDEEEDPGDESDAAEHAATVERERRRLARLAKAEPEPPKPPRRRAVILAHADRDSLVAAIVLARDVRLLEGLWVYPQADLMTFFRSVATDLREDTPIYLVGFTPSPSRDVLQAAGLYGERLVWFDHHEWPPEDEGGLKEAIGEDQLNLSQGAGSSLPLVLATCTRRSRFSDKLVDLATGRFTLHDYERWGRLWWSRLGEIAAKTGDVRSDIDPLLVGRPSDLAREAAKVPAPDLPGELDYVSRRDFRLVHFGGYSLVVIDASPELDLHLCARIARERYGATLSLSYREGENGMVLAGDELAGNRSLDFAAVVEHLSSKLEWVEAQSDGDHVARFRIRDLAAQPERLDEVIGTIAMGRSILER